MRMESSQKMSFCKFQRELQHPEFCGALASGPDRCGVGLFQYLGTLLLQHIWASCWPGPATLLQKCYLGSLLTYPCAKLLPSCLCQVFAALSVGPVTFLLQQYWAGPGPWRYMSVPRMAAHYQRSHAARSIQKELGHGTPPTLLHPQPDSADLLVRTAYALPAWQMFKACMQVRLHGEGTCGLCCHEDVPNTCF